MRLSVFFCLLFVTFSVFSYEKDIPKEKFINKNKIVLATLGDTYDIGNVICSLVNSHQENIGFFCENKLVKNEDQAFYEINQGNSDIVIISSYYVKNNAKVVFSLGSQDVNIMVKKGAKIKKISDISEKNTTVAFSDNATSDIFMKLFEINGWDKTKVDSIGLLDNFSENTASAICNRGLDIVVISGVTPLNSVKDITSFCGINILALNEDVINSYKTLGLNKSVIKGGTYLGNPNDIQTIASPIVLMAKEDTSKLMIYNLTKLVFENKDILAKVYKGAFEVPSRTMAKSYSKLSFHEGSEIYFRENNLIEQQKK